MTNKKMWMGMLAVMLVFGMAVLGACGSSDYAKIKPPVLPDAQSAIVYFISDGSDGVVWDGETPVGDFGESKNSNIMWKTKPGSHYFIVSAFNYIVMRAELEPNKSYYVRVETIRNPIPFASDMIALRVVKPEEGERWLKVYKIALFNDEWRTNFLNKEKDAVKEAQTRLKEAKSKSLSIDLKGSDGR